MKCAKQPVQKYVTAEFYLGIRRNFVEVTY